MLAEVVTLREAMSRSHEKGEVGKPRLRSGGDFLFDELPALFQIFTTNQDLLCDACLVRLESFGPGSSEAGWLL